VSYWWNGNSEATRLGRRGSYRLGTMAATGLAGPRPPRPFRPWFGRPPHRGAAGAWVFAAVAGAALIGVGALAGLWLVPFVVGLVAGLSARRGGWSLRVTLPVTLIMAIAGWGGAFWLQARAGVPVGATARAIVAQAGLSAAPSARVGTVLAVSAILAVAGLWLGRALTPWPGRRLPATGSADAHRGAGRRAGVGPVTAGRRSGRHAGMGRGPADAGPAAGDGAAVVPGAAFSAGADWVPDDPANLTR
jgi:hypothetical protein